MTRRVPGTVVRAAGVPAVSLNLNHDSVIPAAGEPESQASNYESDHGGIHDDDDGTLRLSVPTAEAAMRCQKVMSESGSVRVRPGVTHHTSNAHDFYCWIKMIYFMKNY